VIKRPDEATGDTKKQIEGMGNKDQIKKYLANPAKMPDPKETLRDRLRLARRTRPDAMPALLDRTPSPRPSPRA
jgi:hypothetical protein